MTAGVVLAIDQGTSSTRTMAYDADWRPIASAARRLRTTRPRPGWAEQDPEAIATSVVETVGEVLEAVGGADRIAAVGLANQGETVVAWDRATLEPLAPAVLWQCRRSAPIVERLESAGLGPEIRRRTGLPLDPYFSAGKLRWLMEEVPTVAEAADRGRLAMGTVDAWLTARLGGEARTDASTASRTQLFSLDGRSWDDELAAWWDVPADVLPLAGPSAGDLGTIAAPGWGRPLPLRAMLCDQQAALVGHGGFRRGTTKATYGTGVFVLAATGETSPGTVDGLLTTIAWQTADGATTYALDGGVFTAGALLDWLHGVGWLDEPTRLDEVAGDAPDAGGVRVLPAIAGLGAPWWEADARGVIAGLTGATTRAHLARAVIDAIAQRVADVVEAMDRVVLGRSGPLRVDGGLTRSTLLVQRQADLIGRPIDLAGDDESTALGVALMAAIGAGRLRPSEASEVPRTARRVEPRLPDEQRRAERARWRRFVERAIDLRDEHRASEAALEPVATTF